jgi:hypothetical protein
MLRPLTLNRGEVEEGERMIATEWLVTEAEWLETADPNNASDWFDNGDARRLDEFLKRMASKRKDDLFFVECFRLLATFPQMPGRTYRDLEAWNQVARQVMHDIFGLLLFRPIAVEPAWLTTTVLGMATWVYEEKAFDRLPILADALEDADCDNTDILNHLRGPGPHVRGCWPLDLLLGKE